MNESRGSGREFLHDADHVERDDVELAGAVVEDAQAQQVAEAEGVVANRLLGDEDPVRPGTQAGHDVRDAAAEEVRVAQARGRVKLAGSMP